MTGHTLAYKCRHCGAIYSAATVKDGPGTLSLCSALVHDDAPAPPMLLVHACTPRMAGLADLIGCTMPGPTG